MNIVKVNPFLQGKIFTNLLDDVFNRSISDLVGSDYAVTSPSVNISEDNDNVIMEVAAPGLDKKDFKVAIDKDQLIVSAEKEAQSEEKKKESGPEKSSITNPSRDLFTFLTK